MGVGWGSVVQLAFGAGFLLVQLLQGVAVPRLADLQSILSTFNSLRKTLEEIEGRVPGIFNTLITQSLTYK